MGRSILVFVLLSSVALHGQVAPRDVSAPAAARPLLVRGLVVDEGSGAALAHARFVVLGDAAPDPVHADDSGRFLAVVPPGATAVRILKAGFLPLSVSRSSVQPSGEQTFRMVRSAAINGTVFDPSGIPAAGARVRAQRVSETGTIAATSGAETNDLGEFRIPTLPAGRYVVFVDSGPGGRGGRRGDPGAGRGAAPAATPGAGGRRGRGTPAVAPDAPAVEVIAGQEAFTSLVYEAPVADVAATVLDARVQAAARASGQKVPTGSIQGRVFTPDGAPLRGASVQLMPVEGSGVRRTATSDASGRYEVVNVAAGRYQVRVSRTGYTSVDFGQSRSQQPGRVVSVSEGQRVSRIDVTMPRTGAIAGTIVDAWAEPLEGALVQVWQSRFMDGRTTLANVGTAQRTDDRGRYRVHGLLPGTYVVVAIDEGAGSRGGGRGRGQGPPEFGPPGQARRSGPRVFYPGVTTPAEAAPLQVDVAQDVLGADFAYAPARPATVRGLARNSRGEPVRGRATIATSHRSGLVGVPTQTATIGSDGSFEFVNVPMGEYVVQVLEGGGSGRSGGRNGAFPGGGRGAAAGAGGGAAAGGRQGAGAGERTGAPAQGGLAGRGDQTGPGQTAQGQRGRAQGPGQTGPGGQSGRGGPRGPGAVALALAAGTAREFGVEFVTVGDDGVYAITVDTAPGSTVTGEVVLEGDASGVAASGFAFAAVPADLDTAPAAGAREQRATVQDDGSFVVPDVTGLVRFAATRAPEGWWLKSVSVSGVNGVDDPVAFGRGAEATGIRAVFASGAGTVSGTVTNEQRQVANEFAVAVFSTDPGRWFARSPYVQLASASQDGSFRVAGLPPGEYYVVAVDGLSGTTSYGDWQNPDVLQSLAPAARRVLLRAGEDATADLRLARVR